MLKINLIYSPRLIPCCRQKVRCDIQTINLHRHLLAFTLENCIGNLLTKALPIIIWEDKRINSNNVVLDLVVLY